MSVPLLLFFGGEQGLLGGGLRDGRHHPHAGPPGGLHRFLDLAVFELVVRLEVEDLVLGPGLEDRAQLILQRPLRQRTPIEEVPTRLVDAQDDFVVALRAGIALNPAAMSGVTIMKMIRSTSMMSIIGTTFGSDLTDVNPLLPTAIDMALYLRSGLLVSPGISRRSVRCR
jgi:hypothetical protein